MPTLYIHTGLHKTGTTSLQKAFFDNRAALARQGVLYPQTGVPENPNHWGHHDLAYALRNGPRARTLWRELRAEADEAGLDKVVVSSEELSLLPFPGIPPKRSYGIIAESFEGYDIRLICYLRPQAELVASLYNHNVKSVGERGDILDFMARVATRLDYQHYLNTAAMVLGNKAIEVRRYQKHRMVGGDTVSDMADRLGITLGPDFEKPVRSLNPALTAEGMAEMLEANRRHAENPARLKTARQRILAKHRAPSFYEHQVLSDEMCRTIEALYRSKNRQIAKRYLNLDGDLFAPEPVPETTG